MPWLFNTLVCFLLLTTIDVRASDAGAQVTDAPTPHPVPPFCWTSPGCASAATCQCVWWLTYCNVDDDPVGRCSLTSAGLTILIIGIVVITAVLVIVVGCCACCFCKCCCKPRRYDTPPVQYHFIHGSPQPQTFTPYDKL